MSTSEFDPENPQLSKPDTPPPEQQTDASLAHLSSAQIEEIYQRYLTGEKTCDLIKEFNIETNLNSLLKLLPPIERHDLICPYCTSPATERRRPKTGGRPAPACTGCAHVYETRGEWCGCDGCRHEYISTLNGDGIQRRVPYPELTIREKVTLLSALALTKYWQTSYFSFYQLRVKDPKFAPTSDYHLRCRSELFNKKIILVSEESSHEQLKYSREFDNLDILLWRPNVSISSATGAPLDIDELQMILSDDLAETGVDAAPALIELMYDLAIEELMEYLANQVEMSSVKFKAWPSTREILKSLLPSKSLSNIFLFIWQAVKSADEAFRNKRTNGATHAGNLIPANISKAAEAFEARDPKKSSVEFKRLSHLKLSELSKTIYELILRDHDGAFKIPLPRYIDEVMRPTLEGIVSAKKAKTFLD
ncbi:MULTISPECIES: hypothetical protein [unclassified Pseudomonas]|uniref:hypothetical protein n=1 Tax=unclassified Pseudomonas TaxID=196821 RepID=UPI001B32D70E|nr:MULTISPECIES: hypothetical protein [unclassified Pseudomonas]